MTIEITETPAATITTETRTSGDGRGAARTQTITPKAGTIAANADELRDKAAQALAANTTFLALTSPTNAQVVTHVQRLTRETSAVIRLLLGQLDETSGT